MRTMGAPSPIAELVWFYNHSDGDLGLAGAPIETFGHSDGYRPSSVPETQIDAATRYRRVEEALMRLPLSQREILRLFHCAILPAARIRYAALGPLAAVMVHLVGDADRLTVAIYHSGLTGEKYRRDRETAQDLLQTIHADAEEKTIEALAAYKAARREIRQAEKQADAQRRKAFVMELKYGGRHG